jgi:hypothetical protein
MPYYDVYLIYYWGAVVHQAIFLETAADGSGERYHATGSVAEGFFYEMKKKAKPELSKKFSKKEFLGKVKMNEKQKFVDICEQTSPPGAQQVSSRIRTRTSTIIEYRNCATWVEEVLAALKKESILS